MSLSKYEWTCPICGESRVRLETGLTPRVAAENDLLSHIRSTRGDGHGSQGRCPDEFAGGGFDAGVSVRPQSDRPTSRFDETT